MCSSDLLPYFAFPDKMKRLMQQVIELPDDALRKFGFVLMCLGLLVVYLGQNGGR